MLRRTAGPRTRLGTVASNQKVIAGLDKHIGAKSITLAGTTWPVAELKRTLLEENELTVQTNDAYVAWRLLVGALRAKTKANHPVRKNLEQTIRVLHGSDLTVLTVFGYKRRKSRRPSTAEENFIKAAKAKATRKARGTLGSKQRTKIKGALSGPTLTVTVAAKDPKPPSR
jgi:hypothetical protein